MAARMKRLVLPSLPSGYGTDKNLPGFELTFYSVGHTYKAFVRARNSECAREEAILELAAQEVTFEPSNARLVSVIQTL